MNNVFKMETSFPGSLKAEQDANFALFTTHALLPIFPEASWVQELIQIRVGYVWGVNSIWLRIRVDVKNFFNPDRKSCGFKIPDMCGQGLKQESMHGLWTKKSGRFREVAVSGGSTVFPLNWTPSANLKRKISFEFLPRKGKHSVPVKPSGS